MLTEKNENLKPDFKKPGKKILEYWNSEKTKGRQIDNDGWHRDWDHDIDTGWGRETYSRCG